MLCAGPILILFTFSPLMPCTGQQFSVLMFAHFLSAFFYDTSQKITPHQKKQNYAKFELFLFYSVTIFYNTIIAIVSIFFSHPSYE